MLIVREEYRDKIEKGSSQNSEARMKLHSLHIFLLLSDISDATQSNYTPIFSFGDSYTDTGAQCIHR
jgi:hypothetical protein